MKLNTNDSHVMYHNAVFAHHNLNDINDKNHFERCFERLRKIKYHNVRTLFCLFYHTKYYGYKNISFKDIVKKLSEYLSTNFNCHLLIIRFENYLKIPKDVLR